MLKTLWFLNGFEQKQGILGAIHLDVYIYFEEPSIGKFILKIWKTFFYFVTRYVEKKEKSFYIWY